MFRNIGLTLYRINYTIMTMANVMKVPKTFPENFMC